MSRKIRADQGCKKGQCQNSPHLEDHYGAVDCAQMMN